MVKTATALQKFAGAQLVSTEMNWRQTSDLLAFLQAHPFSSAHYIQGQYITNVYCARSDSDNEINPTVTTLHNPGTGTVSCLCYVVVPNEDYPQTNQVECGLYFTQCPILQNIDTTLQT